MNSDTRTAAATCACGCSFTGAVIDGRLMSPHTVCPACGKECVVGRIAGYEVHAGNRHFYGEKARSITQGCHETEVSLLRKLVGSDYEKCVRDDGTVKFRNRKEERGYVAAMEKARAVNAADPGHFTRQ